MTEENQTTIRAAIHKAIVEVFGDGIKGMVLADTIYKAVRDEALTEANQQRDKAIEDAKRFRMERDEVLRERDEARTRLFPYADVKEIQTLSWSGFNIIGDRHSLEHVRAMIQSHATIDQIRTQLRQTREEAGVLAAKVRIAEAKTQEAEEAVATVIAQKDEKIERLRLAGPGSVIHVPQPVDPAWDRFAAAAMAIAVQKAIGHPEASTIAFDLADAMMVERAKRMR
jgi:hypothetical protein